MLEFLVRSNPDVNPPSVCVSRGVSVQVEYRVRVTEDWIQLCGEYHDGNGVSVQVQNGTRYSSWMTFPAPQLVDIRSQPPSAHKPCEFHRSHVLVHVHDLLQTTT